MAAHRHTVECIKQVGNKLVCSVVERRKKNIGGPHRHSDACKDRWGSIKCPTLVKQQLHGLTPVKRVSGTYSLGKMVVGTDGELPGKILVERIPIMSNGSQVGDMFYDPTSYPQSPWRYSLTKLRWGPMRGSKEPPPLSGIGHDGEGTTAQNALIKFADAAQRFIKWHQEHP